MTGETTPAPEDLQQQIEVLKKEKERLDAEKQLLESQAGAAAARKSQSDASLAAFKAALGDVPPSGITGSVDVKDQTGVLEAALLAMRAVRDAAASIGICVRKALPDGAHVVAMTAGNVPAFLNMAVVRHRSRARRESPGGRRQSRGRPPTGPRPESVPAAGAAGLVLDATTKLLSFFRTDYTVAGIEVSLDDVIALNEVAGDLSQDRVVPGTVTRKRFEVIAPAIYDPGARVAAAKFFLDDVARLSVLRQKADGLIKTQDELIARLTAAAESEADAATRQTLQDQATSQRALASPLRAAIALMDAWYGKLGAPDEKGVAALVNVSREKALAGSIDSGSLLLVKIQAAGGSYLTKKNLWIFIGGMPLFHMGGAAVSFTLLDGRTGTVQAAGVVPIHGGFVKTGDLRATLGDVALMAETDEKLAVYVRGIMARDGVTADALGRTHAAGGQFKSAAASGRGFLPEDLESLLGGNSGSAVIDVATGTVAGLHFAGDYLVANYAVPSWELARDSAVTSAGVPFV